MRLLVLPSALFLTLALDACRDARQSATRGSARPAAEFIVAAGDSAYWVASDTSGLRVRGAPLELARVDGQFVEVYVVDDERSFGEADLVGQSVYKRDLRTGDSVRVFTDSIVPDIARRYARAHPDDQPLARGDEPSDEPRLRAAATLEIGAAHGPFVSYSLHTDVERPNVPLWHTSRVGVLDLRTGRPASLSDVAGDAAGSIEQQRDRGLREMADSIRASRDERGRRASAMLSNYRFDAGSFSITTAGGGPAIAYAVPGSGTGDAGHVLPLAPIPFAEPKWWHDVAPSLPVTSTSGSRDVWRHGAYSVVIRYDSSGTGRLVLRDSVSREWAVMPLSEPATRIYWLDRPAFDAATRHALVRAFEEAAAYGTETHIAGAPRVRLQLASMPR
ncbi:MAG TPA: hypothetical protein VF929_02875 [Gemmatimonadaceae bacterium]